MKKLIALAIVALLGFAAHAADVTYRNAPLSTAVTNVVQFTAKANAVTKPVLFVHKTGAATTNTPVITVTPASGAGVYTVYTGSALTSSAQAVVPMNSLSPLTLSSTTDGTNVLSVTQTASPQIILLPGDILKITGTAPVWATSQYYMIIEETVQ